MTNGIPGASDTAAALLGVSAFGGDAFGGGGSGSVTDPRILVPVLSANGKKITAQTGLRPDEAKNYWIVQQRKNTVAWRDMRGKLRAMGYSTDSAAMSALFGGIDDASNPGFNTGDGAYDPLSNLAVNTSTTSGGGSGSGGPYNYTSRDVQLLSKGNAQEVADATFQSELGRSATRAEEKDFRQAANAMARQKPSVTTTRGVSSGGSDTRTTTTKAGFDVKGYAQDWARAQEGYAENYAATTFMSILDKILSNGGDVIDQTMQAVANG